MPLVSEEPGFGAAREWMVGVEAVGRGESKAQVGGDLRQQGWGCWSNPLGKRPWTWDESTFPQLPGNAQDSIFRATSL